MIQNDNSAIVYTIDISDLQADLPLFGACTEVETTTEDENVVEFVDPVVDTTNAIKTVVESTEDQMVVNPNDVLNQTTEDDSYTMVVDEELAKAALNAVTSGSMTPLIKEELRTSIQHKRLNAGKEELKIKETRKRSLPTEVTPEDEQRKKRRRERNKVAAQKCRTRKRELTEELEQEVSELLTKQTVLQDDIENLEREREQLFEMLRFHDASQATQCGQTLCEQYGV